MEIVTVLWTEVLIEKYFDKWDWEALSGNTGLPWSYKFIEKYSDKWKWKADSDHYTTDIYSSTSGYHEENEKFSHPSLSTNSSIEWSIKMLKKWKRKIDFWYIAKFGKIDVDTALHFKNELMQRELIGWRFDKYSDWRGTANLYRTGWENLVYNKNFAIDRSHIDSLNQTNITLTYPQGNFADDGDYVTEEFNLLEVLKECEFTGVEILDILTTDNWVKTLLNQSFINDSIWKIIQPIFNESFIELYLNSLAKERSSEH